MKNIHKYLLVCLTLLTASCTDLDVVPQDAFGASEIFDDPAAYKSYLAKLYGAFSL